jgi:hypothetical protein
MHKDNFTFYLAYARHAVAWLRHYATNRKVEGLIHDEVIGFSN